MAYPQRERGSQTQLSIVRSAVIACASIALIASFALAAVPSRSAEAQVTGICDRSSSVQRAILGRVDADSCADVTSSQLASINFLWIRFFFDTLQTGDLDGLTRLEFLALSGDDLIPFPSGLISDLTSLEFMYLSDDSATAVPADTFQGLSNLGRLTLSVDAVTTVDPGAFNGLTSLTSLSLYGDALTSITTDTFASLATAPDLERLRISGDLIDNIDTDAFADLTNLEYLSVNAEALTTIQTGMFNGLGNLTWLTFIGPDLTSITAGAFSGIGESIDDAMRDEDEGYTVLYLVLDALPTLPANTFSGLPNLERLAISGDVISTIESDVFNGLTSLDVLYIDVGALTTVEAGVFDDLPADLHTLRLNRGGKEILASTSFDDLPGVEAIDVWDESLTTIKAGFFNGLTTLQRLLFDEVGNLSRVESGAFRGLSMLTKLDLSNNKITTLPDDVFNGLTSLEELILTNNPLRNFPSGFVKSPPCGLHTFDIGGFGFPSLPSAEIDGVSVNILSRLPQPGEKGCTAAQGIRHLILDNTPLEQSDLDIIQNFKILETLSIRNTGITDEHAITVRRDLDLVVLQSLDISYNDLSGLNEPAQRAGFGALLSQLNDLEELYMAGTGIDGDTALVIVQNVNPDIKELSLADNNLVDWNHPDIAHDLEAAFGRFSDRWDLIDLSNTAINSSAAGAIVPYIERTHEGTPEDEVEEVREARFHGGVTLDLSHNYLTTFGRNWLRNWEFLNTIDLSCNDLASLRPETFLPVADHLDAVFVGGNPFDVDRPDYDEFDALLPDTRLHFYFRGSCQRSDYSIPKSITRVLRIEPKITEIAINPGRQVMLEVDVYGRQDILDNGLADRVTITWDDGHVGGVFSGTGHRVEYTAPDRPGRHTIVARIPSEQCFGNFDQCTAHFDVTVNRRAGVDEIRSEPVNPPGTLPTILTDNDGVAYEVFTPEGGGSFVGDDYALTAPGGAVSDGEIIGISIERASTASNDGQTHHRYTLDGDWYRISAVDADTDRIASYHLNLPAEVCIPLPERLRATISDVAIVSVVPLYGATEGVSSDPATAGGLTIHASRVRLSTDGTPQLCGAIISLPADVAAARRGSPEPLPEPEIEAEDEPAPPETGPDAEGRVTWLLLFVLVFIGAAATLAGWRLTRLGTRRD